MYLRSANRAPSRTSRYTPPKGLSRRTRSASRRSSATRRRRAGRARSSRGAYSPPPSVRRTGRLTARSPRRARAGERAARSVRCLRRQRLANGCGPGRRPRRPRSPHRRPPGAAGVRHHALIRTDRLGCSAGDGNQGSPPRCARRRVSHTRCPVVPMAQGPRGDRRMRDCVRVADARTSRPVLRGPECESFTSPRIIRTRWPRRRRGRSA